MRQLERRLAAELHDHALEGTRLLLGADNFQHILGSQRLEIKPVGGVVVGRDGLRVAVDHDGLVAGLGEGEAGVAAAIVELDALADPVRTAAQDDDLLTRCGFGFANRARLLRAAARSGVGSGNKGTLVGRVHVSSWAGELGSTSIDALVDRFDL